MRRRVPGGPRRTVALLASAVVVSPLVIAVPAAQAEDVVPAGQTKAYIVQLAGRPIVAYEGGTPGLSPTAPERGEKVQAESRAAVAYADHLQDQQQDALDEAGLTDSDVVTQYTVAFNGFAVEMDEVEAARMRKAEDVVNVWEDEIRHADTITTPDYLGLGNLQDGSGGVWEDRFGGVENAGQGIVVGVIDTGIDPENPSFADTGIPAPPADWNGVCATGDDDAFECTDKLVGARWYGTEYGNTVIPEEYQSPRDRNGHGSHTAGTAAGNFGVEMPFNDEQHPGSGMAPQAHVAAYKALWQTADGGGSGSTTGLVAAIEDAVKDGVDVINYSISGSRTYVVTPDEIAFMFAARAGIFVATSAGNSGDTVGESSVAHNSPWTTTVAASTHPRGAGKTVTLGNEQTYTGVGVGDGVGPAPLVDSEEVPAAGSSADAARLCLPGSLDAAQTTGRIVICTRGENARTEKSDTVADAGGVGMILVNTNNRESLNADVHAVPSIHLNGTDGEAVKAYEDSAQEPTATISEQSTDPVNAPEMAGFSSYGPALAGGGDLLKPDLTAPGVDILAAYHEDWETGEATFNQISGTSMSTPHVAGLAALMKQEFPQWSPMAVKSAMMTTARDTDDNGGPIQRWGEDATPLDLGAGEVQPAASYNPGLVYDSDIEDWAAYACAIEQWELAFASPTCADLPQRDASDLNYPSIAIGALTDRQTVTRTVTDVTGRGGTYTAQVDAPEGTTVTVQPTSLRVPAGGTATFTLTVDRTDAPFDAYTFGQLAWVSGSIRVESPIAVQPVPLAAPDELHGEWTDGALEYEVTSGYTGTLSTDVDGLVPSSVNVVDAVRDEDTVEDGVTSFTVAAGTELLRISTFASELEAEDVDLYIITPAGQVITSAATGGSDESWSLADPAPGEYLVVVDVYEGPDRLPVPVHGWTLTGDDEGNLDVQPSSPAVTQAEAVDLTVAWSGLEHYNRYLGAVNYRNGDAAIGTTLVNVQTGVERWGGEDRYAVAAHIAGQYPDGADTVYIVAGDKYADALSGTAPAANGLGLGGAAVNGAEPDASADQTPNGKPAPILLVRLDRIPADTAAALDELDPRNILILGGTKSVSQQVQRDLAQWGTVGRVDGRDRYEVSANLARMFGTELDTVYVASGEDGKYPDALTGSALAGHQGAPVLLTRGNRIPDPVKDALGVLAPERIVVLGGPATVTDTVVRELGRYADATERIGGEDRFEVAAKVSAEFGTTDAPVAFVASGRTWPDALTGAALAGHLGVPVELADTGGVPPVVMSELDRLSPQRTVILGGPMSLTEDVWDELNGGYPVWSND